MFEDFKLKKQDKYYLLFLIIFSTILVAHYINFNVKLGISCSDVYVYLLNALYFTGTNIRSTGNIYLSPFVCFLTSILFRLGLVDKISIFIVTGALAIVGNIGLYLLLRQFYDETLSLAGAIVYSALSLNLTWLANGTLDIPAVALTIWLMLFSMMAIKRNPKFYTYTAIFFVLAFFTRYTIVLAVPAILLYYVYENGFKIKKEDKKHIYKAVVIGIILGAIVFSVICIMGQGQFGGEQMYDRASGKTGSPTDPAFNTQYEYYLINLPNFISNSHTVFNGNPVLENPTPLSWGIILILIIGSVLWLKDREFKIEKKYAIPLALFLVSFLIFTKVTSLITIFLTAAGLYLLGKDSDNKLGFVMFVWIISNIIFYTYLQIKVNRYIIPIFPALIYFILKSVDIIHENIKINRNIIPIILIILFAAQGFAFTETFEPTNKYHATEDISNYIIDNNPDYKDIPIGTYNIRPYLWWLGKNVVGIPAGDHERIDESNLTYYISHVKLNDLKNYSEIKNIDQLYLYEKTSP